MRPTRPRIAALAAAACVAASCGKIGPPLPPLRPIPVAVPGSVCLTVLSDPQAARLSSTNPETKTRPIAISALRPIRATEKAMTVPVQSNRDAALRGENAPDRYRSVRVPSNGAVPASIRAPRRAFEVVVASSPAQSCVGGGCDPVSR